MQSIISKKRNLIIIYKKKFSLDIEQRINGKSKIKKIFLSTEMLSLMKKISFIK